MRDDPDSIEVEDPEDPLVPTRRGSDLGGLSDALHTNEMSLSLSKQAVWPASEFQRLVREGLPYPTLTVAYQPPFKPRRSAPNTLVERG